MKQLGLKKPTLIAVSLSCLLFSSSAVALEPITTAIGVVGSPIFCKLINCSNHEVIHIKPDPENGKRLRAMRDQFRWESMYEEGECREYTALGRRDVGTACYENGEWIIKESLTR
jgi:hypothetical protein